MFSLRAQSSQEWIETVANNFNAFLLDHASAERKASAMCVSFVVQYPDRYALHEPVIKIAREELLHYQQVMKLIHERNLVWERDEKDPYMQSLLKKLSTDREQRLLDRLILAAVVEKRGVDRFDQVAKVAPKDLKRFYSALVASEQTHADGFLQLASHFFNEEEIGARLDTWLDWEAQSLNEAPIRAALH